MTKTEATPESEQLAQLRRRSYLDIWEDFLYGYDFFVSYRWTDGRKYAVALAAALKESEQRVSVFLDSEEYAVGDSLSWQGNRAVRSSSRLIFVATPEAATSDHICRELAVFSSSGRRMVSIDFDGTLEPLKTDGARLSQFLNDDLLHVNESADALTRGPSESALNTIIQSLLTELRRDRRRRAIRQAIFAFLVLLASVAWGGVKLNEYYLQQKSREYLTTELKGELDDSRLNGFSLAIDGDQLAFSKRVDGQQLSDACNALGNTLQLDLNNVVLTQPECLRKLGSLEYLNLLGTTFEYDKSKTSIQETRLNSVFDLPHLKHLMLNGTNITPIELSHLAKGGRLETLILNNTSTIGSNEVEAALETNSGLRKLKLYGCREFVINESLGELLISHARRLKSQNLRLELDIRGVGLPQEPDQSTVNELLQKLKDMDGNQIRDGALDSQSEMGGA